MTPSAEPPIVGPSAAEPPIVELDQASVRVDGRTILGPLDLTVRRHERWVLLGPNGSGKTTLLSLAGARRQPSTGRVTVLGTTFGKGDVRALHGRISHSSHVLAELMPPHLTAETVVLTGKRMTLSPWFERYDDEDHRRAERLLHDLGCGHLIGRTFSTGSQGERQRVLLARALFTAPELMILDEPASGLDLPARERLIASLDRAAVGDGPAMLIATHHLEEIPPSATHAALLRDGTRVAAGPIEEVLTPDLLERTFGLAVEVGRRGRRWWAAAVQPGTGD
jgi:iron complex transport system ATP-binding protein